MNQGVTICDASYPTQKHHEANLGCAVGQKTPTVGRGEAELGFLRSVGRPGESGP
jgi:hypothetical protein